MNLHASIAEYGSLKRNDLIEIDGERYVFCGIDSLMGMPVPMLIPETPEKPPRIAYVGPELLFPEELLAEAGKKFGGALLIEWIETGRFKKTGRIDADKRAKGVLELYG
jgi:hypothetical protein